MKPPTPPPPSDDHTTFSEVLASLALGDSPDLSLREMVDAFGERGFGALLLLLTLMALLPWPPGGKTLFAIPIMLLAAEMALQRPNVWLPKFILNRTIARQTYKRLLYTPLALPRWIRKQLVSRHRTGLRGWMRRTFAKTPSNATALSLLQDTEKLARPRLPFLTGEAADVVVGMICISMAIIMALPVPLGDMLPAFSIILLSLGVIQRDGLFIVAGGAFTAISAIYLILVWHTIVHMFHGLSHWLISLLHAAG